MIEREHPRRRLGPPAGVDGPGGAGQGVCGGVAVAARCGALRRAAAKLRASVASGQARGEGCGVAPISQDKDVKAAFAEWKVIDETDSHLVIAWSQLDRRPLVASFVEAAVSASLPQPEMVP
jgi:hypothetical protein